MPERKQIEGLILDEYSTQAGNFLEGFSEVCCHVIMAKIRSTACISAMVISMF